MNLFTLPEYKRLNMIKQKGLSLVELMIAVTLSIILLTGVIQVFLSSKSVFSTQQAVSRIQETGRLAAEFLSRDIRMAGYMGCASRSATMSVTNTLNNASTSSYDFGTAVVGYGAATVPVGTITKTPTANTDVIILRSAAGVGVEIVDSNDGDQLFASNLGAEAGACADGTDRVSGLCDGDVLVVADCTKARIFQATNVTVASTTKINVVHSNSGSYTPGNETGNWGANGANAMEKFEPGSEILTATSKAYYIATGTSGRPSLWMETNGANPVELLEGVENMSLSYGVDTDTTADYTPDEYKAAAQVSMANQWSRVLSVRISLLVASAEDNVLPEKQTYSFAGNDNIDPGDRRLRQVFNSTVGIRSRLF